MNTEKYVVYSAGVAYVAIIHSRCHSGWLKDCDYIGGDCFKPVSAEIKHDIKYNRRLAKLIVKHIRMKHELHVYEYPPHNESDYDSNGNFIKTRTEEETEEHEKLLQKKNRLGNKIRLEALKINKHNYSGGSLTVALVEDGVEYNVSEYDGCESICTKKQFSWTKCSANNVLDSEPSEVPDLRGQIHYDTNVLQAAKDDESDDDGYWSDYKTEYDELRRELYSD